MRQIYIAAISAVIASNAYAQTTWTLATPLPETYYHTKNVRQFADEVFKQTNGALKIDIHSGGTLIKRPEMKRAVQTGQVQIGQTLIGTMTNEAPLYSFDTVPFMAGNSDGAYKIWEAVRPMVTGRLKKQNLIPLFSIAWPTQGLYTKTAIKSADDLKGVKFRSSSASAAAFAKRLGAIPTVMQEADVPGAFMTGLVDMMMTSPTTGVGTQAWDYSKIYYDIPTMFPQSIVIVNSGAWEKLDVNTRNVVEKLAKEAEKRGWEMSVAESEASISTLKSKMTVLSLPADVLAEFKKVGSDLEKDWLAKLEPTEAAAVKAALK